LKKVKNKNPKSSEVSAKLKSELLDYAMQIAEVFHIKLDYSHRSIKMVEKILAKTHKDYKKTKNPEGLHGVALEFAAYIIEVIETNSEKGRWERDHPDFGKDSFPYYWKGVTIFPYSWCLKRIYDGKGDNVWTKYKSLVLNKIQE